MMESIKLTKEHKSKLLEMCTKLFPKNKLDSLQFGTLKFLINYYEKKDPNNSKITFGGWDKIIEIHWFEFCMTWLSHKIIFNPNNKLSACNHNHAGLLESTMSIFYGEKHGIHPIDYLYEEFKKLK